MAAGTVNSENVVGYTKITLTSRTTLMAMSFDEIGDFVAGGAPIPINEAFPYDPTYMTAGSQLSGDQLQIIENGAYVAYTLRSANSKWCKSGTTATADTIAAGAGVLYISQRNPSVGTPGYAEAQGQVLAAHTGGCGAHRGDERRSDRHRGIRRLHETHARIPGRTDRQDTYCEERGTVT